MRLPVTPPQLAKGANRMLNQSADLPRGYLRLVRHFRNKKWLMSTWVARLQHCWFPRHTILGRDAFFPLLVRQICGSGPHRSLAEYQEELRSDALLRAAYSAAGRAGRSEPSLDQLVARRTGNVSVFYALVRELRPEVLVETGTASGLMTSWILAALARNGTGRLISIDLPPRNGELTMEMTLTTGDVGYLVPAQYRDRWTLIAGDAKVHLPCVLAGNAVDFFIHDSLHTRTHMLFELNVARALMRPGTCIVSDDVLWNDSFFSFVESHRLRSLGCISNPNVAVTLNDFDAYELDIGVEVQRGPA